MSVTCYSADIHSSAVDYEAITLRFDTPQRYVRADVSSTASVAKKRCEKHANLDSQQTTTRTAICEHALPLLDEHYAAIGTALRKL